MRGGKRKRAQRMDGQRRHAVAPMMVPKTNKGAKALARAAHGHPATPRSNANNGAQDEQRREGFSQSSARLPRNAPPLLVFSIPIPTKTGSTTP